MSKEWAAMFALCEECHHARHEHEVDLNSGESGQCLRSQPSGGAVEFCKCSRFRAAVVEPPREGPPKSDAIEGFLQRVRRETGGSTHLTRFEALDLYAGITALRSALSAARSELDETLAAGIIRALRKENAELRAALSVASRPPSTDGTQV